MNDIAIAEEKIQSHSQNKSPADILADIAALPLEENADTFSGREHDKVLLCQMPNVS